MRRLRTKEERLFEGHRVECGRHPGRVSWACPECRFETEKSSLEEERRETAVEAARAVVGVPFHHRGRKPSGLDCSGLMIHGAVAAGLQFKPFDKYARGFHGDAFVEAFAERMDPVMFEDGELAGPADAVLVRIGRNIEHAMMLTGDGNVVHADARRGLVVEHSFSFEWAVRVGHVFKMRGMGV